MTRQAVAEPAARARDGTGTACLGARRSLYIIRTVATEVPNRRSGEGTLTSRARATILRVARYLDLADCLIHPGFPGTVGVNSRSFTTTWRRRVAPLLATLSAPASPLEFPRDAVWHERPGRRPRQDSHAK